MRERIIAMVAGPAAARPSSRGHRRAVDGLVAGLVDCLANGPVDGLVAGWLR